MASKSEYITKGILLCLGGIIIAFFPNIISWILYVIGGIIILGSIGTLISTAGEGSPMLGGSLTGIIIGGVIVYLPNIISVHIPLIAGIVVAVSGVIRLISTLSKNDDGRNNKISIIWAVAMILIGLFFVFNPLKVSSAVRLLIGIFLIGSGIFDFVMAYIVDNRIKNESNNPTQPEIIDINSFTVDN